MAVADDDDEARVIEEERRVGAVEAGGGARRGRKMSARASAPAGPIPHPDRLSWRREAHLGGREERMREVR